MSDRSGVSRAATTLLTVAAFVFMLLSTLMVFAQDRIFDGPDFSATAASTLSDPAVNAYLAEAVADELIEAEPNLALGGSLLEEVAGGVLESGAAREVVETAALETHTTFFEQDADGLVLELSDLVVSLDTAVAQIDPAYAELIPAEVQTMAVDVSGGEAFQSTVKLARTARQLTFVFVGLSVATMLALVWLEPNRWHSLGRIGLILGLAGLGVVVMLGVGEVVVSSYGSGVLEEDALAGVWNVVLGDLQTWGWVLIGAGAFVAGLAWSILNVGQTVSFAQSLVDRLTTPADSIGGQVLQLLGVGLLAVWAIFEPITLLTALIRIAGFVLAIGITGRLVRLAGLDTKIASVTPEHTDVTGVGDFFRRAALPTAILLAVGVVGAAVLSSGEPLLAVGNNDECNGHVELCDRRLDQVTMVASHNSMSSTENAFLLPNHLSTITEQLDAGVRGLMIDTYLGRPTDDGVVMTQTNAVDPETIDAASQAAVDAARERSIEDLGDERVYMCHSFCEIGAVDAVEQLTIIREWMEDHPREVLVFVVQDATEPADTAAAFESAGLAAMAWTQNLNDPFPTLGTMIEANKRIFVMVEEDGEGVDWLHPAFTFSQETPFSFSSVEDFSCEPNRGEGDSPLFVVNHFITFALPANQDINNENVLQPRVDACQEERGLQPNLLAIDYATKGDALAVADALNGVAGDD